jgi:signal transduction histidine kinase
VYLYGLVLLGVVALCLGISARLLFRNPPPWTSGARVGLYVDKELAPLVDRPPELAQRLAHLHEVFGFDVAVYRANGERIASAGGDPPGPLDQSPASAGVTRTRRTHTFAAPLHGGEAYLVGRFRFEAPSFANVLAVIAVVLVVLMLVSAPLARGIVRPIERVTQTARAVGAGDLSARTGLNRVDEVGELARAFDDMAARLERLVDSEKELLANVSHELRTPLARIRVALELAEEEGEGARHIEGISEDLRELEELVDNVLSTARLDLAAGREGRLVLDRQPLALAALVEQAAQRFTGRFPKSKVELHIADGLPDIMADARLLRCVVDNILDNAGKYADPTTAPVVIEVAASDAHQELTIRDHGAGVAEADLPRLFDPFFRADRSRERATGGVGLGLALCRRIVEAHGGTIVAELPESGGLLLRARLPVAKGLV